MAADIVEAAAAAASPDDLFLRLEDAGVMLRIDRSVTPTMAKTPTLGQLGARPAAHASSDVVRLGHIRQRRAGPAGARRRRGRDRATTRSSCTAPPPGCSTRRWCRSGGRRRSRCSRSGPASRASARRWPATSRRPVDDDDEKNRLCPPSPFSNTPADWARHAGAGVPGIGVVSASDPDIKAWAERRRAQSGAATCGAGRHR